MAALDQIRVKYPDHLAISYRHVVGTPDPASTSYRLALAAECAAEQERFEQFNASVYRDPPRVAPNSVVLALAKSSGVPAADEFLSCLNGRKYADKVAADNALARQIGVDATPYWFLNGVGNRGAPDPPALEKLIVREFRRLGRI